MGHITCMCVTILLTNITSGYICYHGYKGHQLVAVVMQMYQICLAQLWVSSTLFCYNNAHHVVRTVSSPTQWASQYFMRSKHTFLLSWIKQTAEDA
jgi:hypothetical protein